MKDNHTNALDTHTHTHTHTHTKLYFWYDPNTIIWLLSPTDLQQFTKHFGHKTRRPFDFFFFFNRRSLWIFYTEKEKNKTEYGDVFVTGRHSWSQECKLKYFRLLDKDTLPPFQVGIHLCRWSMVPSASQDGVLSLVVTKVKILRAVEWVHSVVISRGEVIAIVNETSPTSAR